MYDQNCKEPRLIQLLENETNMIRNSNEEKMGQTSNQIKNAEKESNRVTKNWKKNLNKSHHYA